MSTTAKTTPAIEETEGDDGMPASLGILVHSNPKVGKTWLAATAPKPLLLFDAEGGSRFLPKRFGTRRLWDPKNPPPKADGTWDIAVVYVRNYDTVTRVYQWLANRQHPFTSAALDSLTEIQKRCLDKMTGGTDITPEQSHWGDLLRHIETLVREFRDLTFHPEHPLEVVCMTALSSTRNNQTWPLVKGQLADTLPGFPDVIGYLHTAVSETGKLERRLAIQPVIPNTLAGDRTHVLTQQLGAIIHKPSLSVMMQVLQGTYDPDRDRDKEKRSDG